MVIFSLLSVSLNSFLLYSYLPNLPFILWPLLSFQFLSFLFLPPFLSCSHLEHHTCFFLNLSLSFSLFRYLSISLSPYILLLSLFSLFPSSSSDNSFRSLSFSLSLSPVSFIVLSVHLVRLSFSQIVDTPLLFAFL